MSHNDKGRPRETEEQTANLSVYLEVSILRRVEKYAKAQKLSRSAAIRDIIDAGLGDPILKRLDAVRQDNEKLKSINENLDEMIQKLFVENRSMKAVIERMDRNIRPTSPQSVRTEPVRMRMVWDELPSRAESERVCLARADFFRPKLVAYAEGESRRVEVKRPPHVLAQLFAVHGSWAKALAWLDSQAKGTSSSVEASRESVQ